MKRILFALCAISALVLCSCSKKAAQQHNPYEINLFEGNPYLAEIWWGDDYDPAASAEHLAYKLSLLQAHSGGCSSWHKDNFHGRNIDWMMRDFATIIIHMPRIEGKVKYASVSLLAGSPDANKDLLDGNTVVPEEMRAWLPGAVVDGINECGLCINHNIVPYDGHDYIKEGDLYSVLLCRYVLDNCASVREAIDSLAQRRVIQAVVPVAHDYSHFFLSDPESSCVVEWIDGEMVVTEFKADGEGNFISEAGMPAVMTNYFVGQAEKYGFKTNEFFKNALTSAGIERTETVMEQLPAAKTVEDHLEICKSVWYRPFCQGLREWPTENAGFYGINEAGKAFWFYPDESNMHVMADDDIYAAAQALFNSDDVKVYYETFNTTGDTITKTNDYWFTQHSVVYDIDAREGYIIMQEGLFSPEVIRVGIY